MLTSSSPQVSYTEFKTPKQLMVLEIQLGEAKKQMEISAALSTERLNKALKGVGE